MEESGKNKCKITKAEDKRIKKTMLEMIAGGSGLAESSVGGGEVKEMNIYCLFTVASFKLRNYHVIHRFNFAEMMTNGYGAKNVG